MRALRVLLLLAVVLAGALWWLTDRWVHPRRQLPSTPPPGTETAEIVTDDGVRLAAWTLTGTRCAVLLFHGSQGARSAPWMQLASRRGWAVLAIDHRAHGESGGDHTTFGWEERRDVEAAARFARARWPGLPVALWGESMGAAAILYASARPDAAVLEAPYSSITRAFENRAALVAGPLASPLAAAMSPILARRTGVRLEDLRPIDRIPAFAALPLFLATGALDTRATPEELRAFAARAPGATLEIVEGAPHGALYLSSAAYQEKVLDFIASRCGAL